jgi:DNA-binding NarL/FixJ family response regulator
MITLLLVDDEPAVRKGLRMRFAAEADLAVVGEAADGQAALDLAAILRPDVVLLDIEMPLLDGICTAQALRAAWPSVAVIVLTVHDDCATRARALAAGACALIAKQGAPLGAPDDLLAAIRKATAVNPSQSGCGRE